ncbi:D-inositol 3-phosphate glycosyltransferase [Stylophora pistillata]|uniref:D-inositol 3-phosphate glycosyltransferase n=1 Tax=Stylophora pistillata TaxID=50429 RepID=A0A2B4RY10_STYPI|nr:D-inositol 3-phosphate glycosyltransferase [Stylophora pistillata]
MASSNESTATSSLQEEKEQRVIDVLFLCDEWKSSKGGLSTFNREFAINLALETIGTMKIHCYVSKSDDQDRKDARKHKVNLITARNIPGSTDSFECLKIPSLELPNPQVVIGHGRKLGRCAYFQVQVAKCRWIQFVHVHCEDLGKYKKTILPATDTIEENEKKHQMEIDLCKAADAVVAVGARLQQKYNRSLPTVKVEVITPGIFEKFSRETQFAMHRSVKNFNVFLFGRATFEDLSLKGYDIVANAIGSLGKNFKLTFVGSSPGEHQKVEQWFLDNTCITRNQLTIRSYCSDLDDLKTMFYESDLVALPSRTEGFGLVALEAVSADVPVLVSGESGVAEALREVDGGNIVIVESDEDTDEWARRIRERSQESAEDRQANATKLRENYRKVYSWRTECANFRRMIENVMKTTNDSELNMKIDVEEIKPKEPNMNTTNLATESGGFQGVHCQRASDATSPTEGSVSPSGTEDPQAFRERVLALIALNYLQTTPPRSSEEHDKFLKYLKEMRVTITGVSVGSLVITVKCESLQILEELWTDYSSGHLSEMVQNCFVTEKILKELNLAELRLKTTMDIEEYNTRKLYFERVALRDALCSQSYFISSEDQSPKRWRQKTEVKESEKVKAETHFSVNGSQEFGVTSEKQYLPGKFDYSHYLLAG